jgi:hypothetical protein
MGATVHDQMKTCSRCRGIRVHARQSIQKADSGILVFSSISGLCVAEYLAWSPDVEEILEVCLWQKKLPIGVNPTLATRVTLSIRAIQYRAIEPLCHRR